MVVVWVILNINDIWLGLSNEEGDVDGISIELFWGSGIIGLSFNLRFFGLNFIGGVDINIDDVNFLLLFNGNNVMDNVIDVVVMEIEGDYIIWVFDGRLLFNF